MHIKLWSENLKTSDHLKRLGVKDRNRIKWTVTWCEFVTLHLSVDGIRCGISWKYCNKRSGFIKGGEFLDHVRVH